MNTKDKYGKVTGTEIKGSIISMEFIDKLIDIRLIVPASDTIYKIGLTLKLRTH